MGDNRVGCEGTEGAVVFTELSMRMDVVDGIKALFPVSEEIRPVLYVRVRWLTQTCLRISVRLTLVCVHGSLLPDYWYSLSTGLLLLYALDK